MFNAAEREQQQLHVAAEHSKWRREVRREAYVAFLSRVEKTRDLITPLSQAFPTGSGPATPDEMSQLTSLGRDLQIRYDNALHAGQIVRLEGPEAVAITAQELISKLAFLINVANDRIRTAAGRHQPDQMPWPTAVREAHDALEAFLRVAAPALDAT